MASAAAIEGISVYGLRWRWVFSGGVRNAALRLVAMKGEIENPAQAKVLHGMWHDDIVAKVRLFVAHHQGVKAQDDHYKAMLQAISDWVDEAGQVDIADIEVVFAGDPDAWIDSRVEDLNQLYDHYDFYRVCCY